MKILLSIILNDNTSRDGFIRCLASFGIPTETARKASYHFNAVREGPFCIEEQPEFKFIINPEQFAYTKLIGGELANRSRVQAYRCEPYTDSTIFDASQ